MTQIVLDYIIHLTLSIHNKSAVEQSLTNALKQLKQEFPKDIKTIEKRLVEERVTSEYYD